MPFYLFAIVFGALGVAARGQMSGDSNYLAEIAPARHFDAYAFVANVSVLIAGFTPLIAVWIIERDGFQRLFLSTAIAGIVAVLLSGLLGETRARMRATARALRPRGARSA
jgi:MFS family permease